MKSIWFRGVIVVAIIGVSTSAFAIPIYVVDDYKPHWWSPYSSRITIMDSEAPHDEVTLNAGTGKRMTDIAITPGGSRLYTITGEGGTALYRYDVDPQSPTYGDLLGSWDLGMGGTGFKNALTAESETSLLLMSNDRQNIWRINLDASGDYLNTVDIGNLNLYSAGDMAFHPITGTLYFSSADASGQNNTINRLHTIDLSGAPTATEIGIINVGGSDLTQIFGLAFDENGVLYGGRGAVGVAEDVYTISLTDASATFAWTMQCAPPAGINGFASIPEPATVLLLTLGAAIITIKRR